MARSRRAQAAEAIDRGSALMPRLAAPAQRALEHAGYTRLEQFADVTEAELRALHGVGPNAVAAIRRALEENGLSFAH